MNTSKEKNAVHIIKANKGMTKSTKMISPFYKNF